MKQIELTKEQESKLLEMFRVLFPEYFVPNIQADGYINVAKTIESSDYISLIHWFEFCITKLWLKISSHTYHNPLALRAIILERLHPVDYLYKEFKELEL